MCTLCYKNKTSKQNETKQQNKTKKTTLDILGNNVYAMLLKQNQQTKQNNKTKHPWIF